VSGPRRKPPRALRRLFPVLPSGEMARELVENGLANEMDGESFPGLTPSSPVLRHFENESRQLSSTGDPLLDAINDSLEEPDHEDDYGPDDWGDP
jgi:hypothetical protein